MYCPKCGTKNTQVAKFCKNCGQALSTAQSVAVKQPVVNQQKNDVRAQASATIASTRVQTSVHEWRWFIGGLILALIVGGIGLMVAL